MASGDAEPALRAQLGEVEYRVLGPVTVSVEGRPLKLGGPRQQMVLAVLLSRANHTVSQDALIEAVWAGEPPEAAKATLQGYVYGLRRELGSDSIVRHGDGYRVDVEEESFDALGFEHIVAEGRQTLPEAPIAAATMLHEGLAMWYGTPYGDLGGSPALAIEVARLDELRLVAVESRVEAELAAGNHAGVVGDLDTLVREHPLRERFRAQQMVALYRSGRQAEALRAYQQARTYLGEELGIEPSSELRELEQRILDQDPSLELVVPGVPDNLPPLDRSSPPAPGLVQGRAVRGYELRQPLGEGDFGLVYRAYQPTVGREVAVKVIRPEYANEAAFVRRFEREAQTVARLEHPHIVPLFDYWRDPDGAYLVMPYLRGGSLAGVLRHGGWNLAPALRLIDQVGGALAHAHRQGVVHRDVKPSNVLLDEEGNAYLSDFGIAARLTDDADTPLTTTLAFLPPEELRGEAHTARSDVFSLGVLAFQLVTGVVPPGRLPLPSVTLARPGLPADLDQVLARATDDEPANRFEKVEDMLRALRQAVGGDVLAVAEPAPPEARREPARNPYKGLRAFRETDAVDFFGRDALVAELIAAVVAHNLVTVVGPSGSGKSSVVRAGLIPALRAGGVPGSRHWLTTDMYPGSYPFEELEAALLRVAVDRPSGLLTDLVEPNGLLRVTKQILPGDDATLVLVVDQFEELFAAVASEATRRLFLDNLVAVATDERSRVRVVLTMRADFFNRPLEYAEFAEVLGEGMVTVGPPTRDGLAQAIAAPARGVGIDLEPGLMGRMISDVEEEPGGLPLLQYALTELFARRQGDTLTIDGYEETGGVLGALGRRSEELFTELGEDGQEAARQLFLRLVTVDETADTRRRVRQTELKTLDVDQPALDEVLRRYGSFRLLSFDRDPVTRSPTVEVAHEALLREWERLRSWIDERREELRLSRRIAASAQEWAETDGDPSFLLRGARLEQAEQWQQDTDIALATAEVEYLDASRRLRAEEEATIRRRRRWALAALAAAIAVLAVLGAIAFVQRNLAQREARLATARELAGESILALEEDPERGILLALEAADATRSAGEPPLPETIGALQRAVQESRLVARFDGGGANLAMSPDGSWVAVDEGDGATDGFVIGLADGRRTRLAGPGPSLSALAVSPDGALVAAGYGPPAVILFDPATGAEVRRLQGPAGVYDSLDFSPDGDHLLAVYIGGPTPDAVTVWSVDTGETVGSFEPGVLIGARAYFLGSEQIVVSLPGASGLGIFSVATGERIGFIDTAGARQAQIDPARNRIAVSSPNRLEVYDLTTKQRILDLPVADALSIAWSSDGRLLAYSGNQGVIAVVDAETGEPVLDLAGSGSIVFDLAFTPDGSRVVNVTDVRETLVWDVTPTGPDELGALALESGPAWSFQVSPDESLLAAYHVGPGTFEMLDVASGEVVASLPNQMVERIYGRRLASPDLSLVGSVEPDGSSAVLHLPTLEVVAELGRCTIPHAFSPDDALVLVAPGPCSGEPPPDAPSISQVVDVDSGEVVFRIPFGWIFAAVFDPTGTMLAVTDQYEVRLYEVATGRTVGKLAASEVGATNLTDVSFDPEGEHLAVASTEGVVAVFDLAAVADGSTMGEALVFNQVTHTASVPTAALSDTGLLATRGFDSLVRLWDLDTGELLVEFRTEIGGGSPDIKFSPDGSSLLYPEGNVIRRFYIDPERLIELAESRVTRSLTPDECRRYLDPAQCPSDET